MVNYYTVLPIAQFCIPTNKEILETINSSGICMDRVRTDSNFLLAKNFQVRIFEKIVLIFCGKMISIGTSHAQYILTNIRSS